MSTSVISVENLSKKYRIGEKEDYGMLRESLVKAVKASARRLRHLGKPDSEQSTIWALKDVSFEVQEGEVVGIIGRNGAGKSTLLKILSRITEPTDGIARIHGRVGSLLEVGTGFHPELTGRENIYLNGAILGMKKAEINRKFDEIIDFSEIGKFIDTPVKRYSSGMYVRLAFAVAANLEPEILLVDEVLAVGDVTFQKKCLGKMSDVAKGGRTVLFVSHNMTAVRSLCKRAILLSNGLLAEDGLPDHVVNTYLDPGTGNRAERVWRDPAITPANELVRWDSVRVLGKDGTVTYDIESQDSFEIEIQYWNLRPGVSLGATVILFNQDGTPILTSLSNHDPEWHKKPRPEGRFRSVCRIPGDFLADGRYSVTVLTWSGNYRSAIREEYVVEFRIHDAGKVRGDYFGGMLGVVLPLLKWTTEYIHP